MDLSIIIVSYNVRAFLEKCLISVYRALGEIDAEVFVVDNHSIDDTVQMVRSHFPDVKLIVNKDNLGFSKANNIAIRQSKGEYVLLLNPDTVVSEDTFRKCLRFMEENPETGAIGVKMYDGTGTYLPESKRGLPSPLSSFFKITGLNRWFPNSNFFNHYYLGGLDQDEIHKVDVLTGAFMFLRKKALDITGLLDEDFFMYGEDIDLSYRLIKAGYKNYYLPTTSIIHYKGESTRRSSIAYVRTFYKAMMTFVAKHYKGPRGFFIRQVLNAGIVVRGVLSGIRRFLGKVLVPIIDLAIIYGAVLLVSRLWASWYFGSIDHFEPKFYRINVTLYAVLWFAAVFLGSAGNKGRSIKSVVISVLIGTGVVLLIYSLLDYSMRTSRAVILISSVVILVGLALWTYLLNALRKGRRRAMIAVVGSGEESERVMELINRVNPRAQIAGAISVDTPGDNTEHIGSLDQLPQIVKQYGINELIFASEDMPFSEISKWMAQIGSDMRYKIASRNSSALVGSNSKWDAGGLYTTEVNYRIDDDYQKRNKRLFDVFVSGGVLLTAPLAIFTATGRIGLRNAWNVLSGKKTWVSYDMRDERINELPSLKPGIFRISDINGIIGLNERELHMHNYLYAKEYSIWRDLERIFSGSGKQEPNL